MQTAEEDYNAKQFKATVSEHQALLDSLDAEYCLKSWFEIVDTESRMTEIGRQPLHVRY